MMQLMILVLGFESQAQSRSSYQHVPYASFKDRQGLSPWVGYIVVRNIIQAIAEMPTPRGVLELQRVVGMGTYLRRFIPNLSV